MREETHLEIFKERKETIFKWAIEIRGPENSQRIIGDNASRAMVELLSAYLYKKKKIKEGFQLNHRWFKSERVSEKIPEFEGKGNIIKLMVRLENDCEMLSYGAPKPFEKVKRALGLFNQLEELIGGMYEKK